MTIETASESTGAETSAGWVGAAKAVAGVTRATAARAAAAREARRVRMDFLSEAVVRSVTAGTRQDESRMHSRVRQSFGVPVRHKHHPADTSPDERHPMSKRARKRRSRKGNKANHGRKPNA